MMADISGAVLGAVANELLVELKKAIKKTYQCKSHCKRLQSILEELLPIMDEIFSTGVELSQIRQRQLRSFHDRLKSGIVLVQECSQIGRFDLYRKFKYAKKILSLEKYITSFSNKQGWAHTMSDVHHMRVDVQRKLEDIECKIENTPHFAHVLSQFGNLSAKEKHTEPIIPELPEFFVGLNVSVEELKKLLLHKVGGNSVVGVNGMGGSGKTTLATAVCYDKDVKEYFKERILFATVSQSPNLMGILERVWQQFIGGWMPCFNNIEDARTCIQHKLKHEHEESILVVLDDVWKTNHLEQLLFKGSRYKTLVTTRNSRILDSKCSRYDLKSLSAEDATKLFCFWAFGHQSIPPTMACKDTINEVIEECKGLPLALKVIGRSLRDQPHWAWESARNKLYQGKTVNEEHNEGVVKRIDTSLEFLEKELQECFLDLGLFPEGHKNPVETLLDIWVYVHHLDLPSAYASLLELASRNLLTVTNSTYDGLGNSYGSNNENSFTQHDVLHDLAIHKSRKSSLSVCERVILPQMADGNPNLWKQNNAYLEFQARFVSFHTGPMEKGDWSTMSFPNAEVLLLNFEGGKYCLPPFIRTMQKLKVLIVQNTSSTPAKLDGTSVLASLCHIRSVRFERVVVPPLNQFCESWKQLEKLYLIFCQGNMSGLQSDCINFPHLVHLTIDHCINLNQLPQSVCNMAMLRTLSITNCHDLTKLSDKLGNLSHLQVLKLSACPTLEELPHSLCHLRQLQFLDVSLCENLKQLPENFGELANLKYLDTRECSRLKQLPKSCHNLKSLEHVICDQNIGNIWESMKSGIPCLNVKIVETSFHLDWLDE